jgi:hypothetical protein
MERFWLAVEVERDQQPLPALGALVGHDVVAEENGAIRPMRERATRAAQADQAAVQGEERGGIFTARKC